MFRLKLIAGLLIIVLLAVIVVLLLKYLGPEKEIVTDFSLENIKTRGKLIVGTFPEIGTMTFKDELGNYAGHDIDIAKEIASELGVSLEIKELFFPDMLEAAKTGEIDIAISAITITSERAKEMLFSIPYFDAGQTIVVHKDNEDIKLPEDLRYKKVGVPRGTTCEKAAKEYVDPSFLTSYDNFEEIARLVNGELDAIVQDYVGAVGAVKDNPSLKIVGEPFTVEYYGIPTKLGNDALIEKINSILREMKRSGKLGELKDKWF